MPAYDSITSPTVGSGNCVPGSSALWSSGFSYLTCNDVDGYIASGTQKTWCLSPRMPIKAMDGIGSFEGYGTVTTFANIASTGYAPDGTVRIGNVADPDDAGKYAFILRTKSTDTQYSGGWRAEMISSGTQNRILRGQEYWIAFSVRIPTDWANGATSGVGSTTTGADEALIFQIHATEDVGDTEVNPTIALTFVCGGTTGNSVLKWRISSNANLVTLDGDTTDRYVWTETGPPFDSWQHYVIKIKPHYSSGQSPYTKIYRALGAAGDIVTLVDESLPNQYNNVGEDYVKHGVYYYASTGAWSNSRTEWVLHSKGIYIYKDDASISQSALIQHLRSV